MADINFICSACGKSLVIDSAGAGIEVTCPDCNTAVKVPDVSQPAFSGPNPGSSRVSTEARPGDTSGNPNILLTVPLGFPLKVVVAILALGCALWIIGKHRRGDPIIPSFVEGHHSDHKSDNETIRNVEASPSPASNQQLIQVLVVLWKQADELISSGDPDPEKFSQASTLFTGYTGEFASETQELREDYAKKYRDAGEAMKSALMSDSDLHERDRASLTLARKQARQRLGELVDEQTERRQAYEQAKRHLDAAQERVTAQDRSNEPFKDPGLWAERNQWQHEVDRLYMPLMGASGVELANEIARQKQTIHDLIRQRSTASLSKFPPNLISSNQALFVFASRFLNSRNRLVEMAARYNSLSIVSGQYYFEWLKDRVYATRAQVIGGGPEVGMKALDREGIPASCSVDEDGRLTFRMETLPTWKVVPWNGDELMREMREAREALKLPPSLEWTRAGQSRDALKLEMEDYAELVEEAKADYLDEADWTVNHPREVRDRMRPPRPTLTVFSNPPAHS